MKQYFTYIVRCNDGSLYTGFTTDVNRRVKEHNGFTKNKGARATRMKRPVTLVYYQCFTSKNEALSREWHIKRLSKAQKERLIEDNAMMHIILASSSPRRKELLSQAGIDFEVILSDIDEVCSLTKPNEYVEFLSQQKAKAVFENHKGRVILAADTVVAFDGNILGKPKDRADAVRMLTMLSGKIHQVYTGVTIIDKNGNSNTFSCHTDVEMYDNDIDTINAYVATGDCDDKAGAYGIQTKGAVLIKSISGDYNNVVGLPLSRVYKELLKLY